LLPLGHILSPWQYERNRGGKEFFIIVNRLLTMMIAMEPRAALDPVRAFAPIMDDKLRPRCGRAGAVGVPSAVAFTAALTTPTLLVHRTALAVSRIYLVLVPRVSNSATTTGPT
jgi:hypothetical protein